MKERQGEEGEEEEEEGIETGRREEGREEDS